MGVKRRTTDEFKEKVKEKYGYKVEILSEYLGGTVPIEILYHCEKHGDTYSTINAKNIFIPSFNPCKNCESEKKSNSAVRHLKKDKTFYYERMKKYCEDHGGKLISKEYTKAKDIYEIQCGNPDHPHFFTSYDSLVNKPQWCPYCSGRKGNFEEEIKEIIESKNGELLSPYINSETHLLVKCKEHNYEWDITSANLKKGRWCPICSLPFSEKVVYDYLVNKGFNVKVQYTFDDLVGEDGDKLKYDFGILDSKGMLIQILEVDDCEHWYNHKSPRRLKARMYDEIKDKYCDNNNIELHRMVYPFNKVEITYEEYYNYIDSQLRLILKEIKKKIT